MEHFYDEFSKSLAASVPRRESLRRMGAVFAGAITLKQVADVVGRAGEDEGVVHAGYCIGVASPLL